LLFFADELWAAGIGSSKVFCGTFQLVRNSISDGGILTRELFTECLKSTLVQSISWV